ncbi:hypothetical protein [Fontivita pretiosa]|uniref:helix-hairpin-helix domain-containing protein n=1 Tax=Fontivita pretiosa TaxID=2989684 RepID=UPI003D173306
MEWVQGQPLIAFIEKHLGDRSALLSLARRWVEMVKALQRASIAHGDLQHGNVLIAEGQLRLIDYDGMYVPALSGEGSHEVGHRNYQHPLRSEADFGPYVDNFSAWVVYVSLVALAVDPTLWQRFRGGDECLLFRREDFEHPESSDLLRLLERHHDEVIGSAAAAFKSLLYLGPRDVPSLDGQVLPPAGPSITTPSAGASWIKDHIGSHGNGLAVDTTPSASGGGNFTVPSPSDPSWIQGALEPTVSAVVSFSNSATLERIVVAVSALLIAAPLNAALDLWPLRILALILVNLTLWICRYRSDDSVCRFRALTSTVREIQDQIRAAERDVEAASREKTRLLDHNAAEQARLASERRALEAKEKTEIDECQVDLCVALSSLAARRQAVDQQQADALRIIQNEIGSRVAVLNGQISTLKQVVITELNRALQAKQQQHITDYLRQFGLDRETIPGIGPAFKLRLISSGFRTAADIDLHGVQRVHGIGPTRARLLVQWRSSLEASARRTMPSALSPGEEAMIRTKYEAQRRMLEQQRDSEQQRLRREEVNIRAKYWPSLEQLEQEEKATKAMTQTLVSKVHARYAQEYRAIQARKLELERDTASRLREIDERIAETRRKLFSLHWERCKAARKLGSYVRIRFSEYVKRVFVGSKAA